MREVRVHVMGVTIDFMNGFCSKLGTLYKADGLQILNKPAHPFPLI